DFAKNRKLAVNGPNVTSDEQETTGRIGLMYRFDNGLSPYISYSEAFSMNLGTDGTSAANTLKPTTGEQEEIGIKYLSPDKTLAVTMAYFDITETNRIVQGQTPGGVEQVGSVIDGWELQINKRWQNFETQFAYTDLNAKNDNTGDRLSALAEKTGSWWNKLYLGNNWRVGAGIRYIGDVVGGGGAPEIPSETLYDAMIGYAVGDWDFTVDAKNLTDEE
ncbi:MAG TPA: TonB-dependent siderophore receptor, partial [Methylophaga sp.]|nr:TonB-dependent siderophore receptor [Methylophaga sp.]